MLLGSRRSSIGCIKAALKIHLLLDKSVRIARNEQSSVGRSRDQGSSGPLTFPSCKVAIELMLDVEEEMVAGVRK